MKLDYEYIVQKLEPNGHAIIEYQHPELGSVSVYMMLPLDRPDQIHRKIIERFPVEAFYSNWLARHPVESPQEIRGTLSIDFDDYFYDIQHATTCTEV